MRERVERLLADGDFAAVHVEQVQALPQAAPALARGLTVVLRAQNVESDLWRAAAERGGLRGLQRFGATVEARRLARWEGRAVAAVAVTAALTAADAARLSELAADSKPATAPRVVHLPAPFPGSLPAATRPLPGAPAVVVLGSGGWLPNRDGAGWFKGEVWPAVRRACPGARLHLFGEGEEVGRAGAIEPGVVAHPPPADSREAFPPGAILAVPLRIASGVRMKILEAWARGVPVVATPEAAAGLDAESGRDLLLAATAEELAAAIARLAASPELAARLVEGGRALLAARHQPAAIADRLIALYRGE